MHDRRVKMASHRFFFSAAFSVNDSEVTVNAVETRVTIERLLQCYPLDAAEIHNKKLITP